MINLPLTIKQSDNERIAIYYSSLHDDLVEEAYLAVITEENKPLVIKIMERVMDSTYVYLGEL